MPDVTNTLVDAAGSPVVGADVQIELVGGRWSADGSTATLTPWAGVTDADGTWTVDLPAQADYEGTTYYVVRESGVRSTITVPDTAGPHEMRDLLVTPVPAPGSVTLDLDDLADVSTSGATSGQVLSYNGTLWVPATGGGGGGVTDHGVLTGLADDDHTQYQLRTEEGTANGYAGLDGSAKVPIAQLPTGSTSSTVPLGDHTHDTRYYTETETDTLLGGKANTSHTHAAADLASGTLAIARIPLGSTASTVTVGNDARLSDARTPTAHAASHATGGSDPITPASIGAAEYGTVYPLAGYGFHSASCAGEAATVQSSWSSWHTRIWVPAGNAITKVGMVVNIAGTLGVGGLNAVAIYADDGQTLLGQTVDDDNLWTVTGLRTLAMQADIAAAAAGRFVRVIVNIDGYSAAPNVVYAVPAEGSGATINGTGSLQRRSAFKSAYTSFPATIDPDTLGTPTNFLPFIVLG